jgi:hypothetical protein
MTKFAHLVCAVASLCAVPAIGETSPFLGRWELDLARMPADYGPPPKRVVYAFIDKGAGQWLTNIDITGADGSSRHIGVRYHRDGKPARGEGDMSEGDTAAVHSPADDVLVMSIAANKRLGSVRVYAISADGQEMTESAANVTDKGTPFVRNFHFRRIG